MEAAQEVVGFWPIPDMAKGMQVEHDRLAQLGWVFNRAGARPIWAYFRCRPVFARLFNRIGTPASQARGTVHPRSRRPVPSRQRRDRPTTMLARSLPMLLSCN